MTDLKIRVEYVKTPYKVEKLVFVDRDDIPIAQFFGEEKLGNAILASNAADLYNSLEEAVFTCCRNNAAMGEKNCKYMRPDIKYPACMAQDGSCYVQKWIKILRRAKANPSSILRDNLISQMTGGEE